MGLLGLRLVKRSVNQDDPGTYHLFYGDAVGHPGTELTFFPWPGGAAGVRGAGQAVAVAFAVPAEAMDYWIRRLQARGVRVEGPSPRFDEEVIAFRDPHGLSLELVAGPETARRPWIPWEGGPVPPGYAIRGIHGVAVQEMHVDPTGAFLSGVLGFRLAAETEGRLRFHPGTGGSGALLDLLPQPAGRRGRVAVGTVHHVAWRVPDAAEQARWREEVARRGVAITPVIDRFWFRSVYFREPGGVLFEIATDGPGFTVDEPQEALGERLILPPWLEPERPQIEARLPALHLPQFVP